MVTRILYIGKFHKFYSTENYVAYALEQKGCEVDKMEFTTHINAQNLIDYVHENGYDVVMFSKPSSVHFPKFIRWCKANQVLTVLWLWDLYWGYRNMIPIHMGCDLVFSTDGGHDLEWKYLGINHVTLRQGIHQPDNYCDESDYQWDVGFVGNPDTYPQRKRMVNYLASSYGGRFILLNNSRGPDLNRALSKIKVIVGDSYPSENYWSNRVYEITGRGGFLLHPETSGMEKEWTDGRHLVYYPRGQIHAMRELVDLYLADEKSREEIRLEGFKRCSGLTYEFRVDRLLEYVRRGIAHHDAVRSSDASSDALQSPQGSLAPQ